MTHADLNPDRKYDVLLLDFGGVCLASPVELHRFVEERLGLPTGTFEWMGPLDPANDELFRESVSEGGISERGYWAERARQVGEAAGIELDMPAYVRLAYSGDADQFIRPGAVRVAALARAAGMGVSVLTNDLRAFHDEEWVDRVGFLSKVDHLIDCSHIGFLKPDQRAYELALETLVGVDPARILFVDDQPLNATGAESVGMKPFWFDISDADRSWQHVAERLGVDDAR